MKLCPNCGSIAALNSYFGAYICEKCHWSDDSLNKVRNSHRGENIWLLIEKEIIHESVSKEEILD